MAEIPNVAAMTDEQFAAFCNTPKGIAIIPAGHLVPIAGPEVWVDGGGAHLSKEQFIALHGVDPAEVWARKKAYRKANGGGVRYVDE